MCQLGVDRRREGLLGPNHRLKTLQGPTQQGGVCGDGSGGGQVRPVGGPPESGAEIGEFGIEPIEGRPLVRAVPDLPVSDGLVGVVRGMTVADLADGPGGGELFLGILADGFQNAIASVAALLADRDQGFADQRVQHVQHLVLVEIVAEVGGRSEIEPAGEYHTTLQQCPFVAVEQVIGPAQGVAQRLMAF